MAGAEDNLRNIFKKLEKITKNKVLIINDSKRKLTKIGRRIGT